MKWEMPISVLLLTSCIRLFLMTSLQEETAVMNLLPFLKIQKAAQSMRFSPG